MAGGIASSIIMWTVDKLRALATTAASSSAESRKEVEEELRKLQRTMLRIQAELDDSEEKDIRDEPVRLWLSELKDVAYDAQDAVEEYEYQVLRAEAESRSRGGGRHKGKHVEVCDYSISAPSRISFPDDLASKVKEIRGRFDEITSDRKALQLGKKHGKRRRDESGNCRQTSSCFDESIVFGREDEKEKLIGLLLSEVDDVGGRGGTVSLIPIIGMGGVGKTTLAQLVYNDPRVSNYFDTRGWVCVSEEFDVVGLTRKILVSFFKTTVDYTELNELQQELKENLQGKKFLLVLDDVWNEKPSLWELLKVPLLKAGVGKVIVTTRNECVARNMQTMEPLSLNTLPFDKCWMLFEKLALLEGLESSSRHNNLVDIGRKIVEKCKGLPLAVKVIARALSYEDDEDKWTDILESERWELVDANLEILPALKISYDYLPIDLKRCFRYLSLFPKDTVLYERKIVQLWMSQGLLRPSRSKQAEDVGSDYVRNLVDRSILQTKVIPGPIYLDPEEEKGLVLHDLVHDLAQSVAQGECLSIAANKLASIFQRDGDKFHKVRHLYLVFDDRMAPRDVKALLKLKRLRTLITNGSRFNEKYCSEFIDELFHNLKYLRALNFSRTHIAGLPDSIGDLKLLRYLSIEGIEIHSLPESICSLYNLQILSLTGTLGLRELPSGIVNLPNIRHLMLSHTRIAVPRGLGKLTYLQTLDCFALGPTSWRIEIEELKGLVNLRGKLIIENLRYVDKSVPRTETPLQTKDRIEFLTLDWYEGGTCKDEDMDEDTSKQVLECFRPHPNLQRFLIHAYGGARFATWLGDSSFSKLVNIEIVVCLKCNLLPPLGQLPSLRVLAIKYFSDLQRIGREFCGIGSAIKGFPSLETLTFLDMENWQQWDGVEAGDFPRLLRLRIDGCPKLRIFPHHPFSLLRKLELRQFGDISDDAPFISLDDDTTMLPLSFRGFHSFSIDMNLPSLQELEISRCSNLTSVTGLTNLTSLHSLTIDDCPYLRLPPTERLSSTLQHLKIR
ncbi:unnamed protein product, partial [Musa acuminata subsp. burmannicoides]